MLPRSKGKKKISLENVNTPVDREIRFNATDLSPLRKVLNQSKPKKTSLSRESNNRKSAKSKSKPSSRIEELAGKIFKTQNTNPSCLEFGTKRSVQGYYLPATSGMKTAHPRMKPDGIDFDSYLFRLRGRKNKLSLSNTGTDKTRLLAKRKSCEKTPLSRLNITCDLTQTLKCQSKSKSKSSKKSHNPSREEEDTDGGEGEKDGLLIRQRTLTKSKKKSEERKPSRQRSQSTITDKLDHLYKRLCSIVEDNKIEADDKLTSISKLFVKYVNLVEKMNSKKQDKFRLEITDQRRQELSSKILNFFCFYSKMNIESYIYTRSLALKALKGMEEFISKEKDILNKYMPSFFKKNEQITIVEAVKLIKGFAGKMIDENKLLTDYIKQHMGSSQVLDMVKKTMTESSSKPELSKIEVDIQELKKKINQSSSVRREALAHMIPKQKNSAVFNDTDNIPTQKEKIPYRMMSSSRNSLNTPGDLSSNNHPISDLGNSNIMRFRNEEEFNKELNPGALWNGAATVGNKIESTPLQTKYDSKERAVFGKSSTPSKMHRSYSSDIPMGPPSDTKVPEGASLKEKENLKNKLKLNLPMIKPVEGFHDEFMKKFDEFSISWRMKILQEKNAKHYNIQQ